ncbi:MAG: TM2 domain-containing membrane protein YozV [Saprospiraceae bacterium]|jgi:TM2 domain-containing membrane protein YozV
MSTRKYQPRRNRTTAAAISFILGAVGGQRFYLRQKGPAFFMIFLLIATSFKIAPIFFLIGIFEAVRFLSMSDQAFDRKYNRYASTNRKDDYLEQRRERQVQKSRNRTTTSTRREQRAQAPTRSSVMKANPFKNSGIKKYKDYDLEGAIEDFSHGLSINQNDIALHFNIACAYSMTEVKDKAYYHLSKAVELGFKDFERIKTKDDLAFVRIQPEFDEFEENGFNLGARSASQPTSSRNEQSDEELVITDDVLLSQLNKLAELRKKGLLSTEEFNLERKKLLRR